MVLRGVHERCSWGRPVGTLLLAGTFLVGPLTGDVGAQPRNRVELLAGGGAGITNSNWNGFSPAAAELGATFWWNDDWGVSGRHEFHAIPDSSYFDGRFSTVTLRRRWLLNDDFELDLGFGAAIVTGRGWLTGGAVPLELLVGRKLSRHFGIKGGYRHEIYLGDGLVHRPRFVGLAVIGF